MRKGKTPRALAAVTVSLLVAAMVVVMAVPVLAHHPEVEASAFCEEDGQIYIDYATWAWVSTDYFPNPTDDQRTNNDVGVYLDGVLVDSGAFNVDNAFTFEGRILVPSEATSATVRVVPEVAWGVEENLGAAGDFREVTVELPSDCEPPSPRPNPTPDPDGTIGDLVWQDTNGDGYQGDFEYGVAGVTVHLIGSSGLIIDTTSTDASGNYLFSGLSSGTYEVQFILPAGFELSPLRAATPATDSDAGAAGRTGAIALASGETDLTWDAGIYRAPEVLPQVITATTSTTAASVTVETLPFTGSSGTGTAGLGVALLTLGGLLVLMARGREDETVIPTTH